MIENIEADGLYLCTAEKRFQACILNKNFCCAYCSFLSSCLEKFKYGNYKIKPCVPGFHVDCDFLEKL